MHVFNGALQPILTRLFGENKVVFFFFCTVQALPPTVSGQKLTFGKSVSSFI